MFKTLLPVLSLLAGAAVLLLGNGLQGILIPVRASLENFPTSVIGLLASAYSVGFVAGCFLIPYMVRRVGHIRAFAVLAAVAASVVLLLALLPYGWVWTLLRVVSGFCFAGIFMVIESWLNERSTNATRGQIFSVYMIVNLLAVTLGQMLLPTADPADFVLFAVTAMLITLGLVPVALSTSAAPTPIAKVKLRLGRLYRMSPVGVVGCFFIGMTNSAQTGLGAVYAQMLGLSVTGVALYMSAAVVGGALSQFPVGHLSDRMDRRRVIVMVCLAAALLGAVLAKVGDVSFQTPLNLPSDLSPALLILTAAVFGFCIYPLYSLCVAHTNDYVAPEDFVEASSGLLLTYGLGAILGPFVAAFLMERLGAGGLYVFTAVTHLTFCLFTLYRMTRRAPAQERTHYVEAGTSRTTPVAIELDPRARTTVDGE